MQPINLVTSPRANPPRMSLRSRQGNAGVIINPGDGSPSIIMAQGNNVTNTCLAKTCRSKRCLTCPDLLIKSSFISNVTNRKYEVINPAGETLSCNSQNVIYLLSCKECGVQDVGETVLKLSKRMNIHRTSKSGCEHMIEHYSKCCLNSSFSVQIIEKLHGNGYDELGEVDNDVREKRLEREDFWMKTLRTHMA